MSSVTEAEAAKQASVKEGNTNKASKIAAKEQVLLCRSMNS